MAPKDYHAIFSPRQRSAAMGEKCPVCRAAPFTPCVYVCRRDRLGREMPGLHVGRYLTVPVPNAEKENTTATR